MQKVLHFLFFLALVGCYPEGPEYVDELDSVYTNYSPEFNFASNYTYALPEGVLKIDGQDDNTPEFIDEDLSNATISALRANLNARGWTEVDESENPDVVMLATGFDTDFYYYYDFGWWDWYYPGYFPGWGWYYPYYPVYVDGFSIGTLFIQMTYADGITNDEVPVEWVCLLNGVLQGSDAGMAQRITTNINQAFSQAPFNN